MKYKKENIAIYIIFASFFLIASPSWAYKINTSSTGAEIHWSEAKDQGLPVGYIINQDGTTECADCQNDEEFDSFHASFQTWEDVPTSSLSFTNQGFTAQSTTGYDGVNLLTFVGSGWDHSSSAIAVTLTTYRASDGAILDSDIEFNADRFSWSHEGASGKMDIQNIATHEIGHFFGLGHTSEQSATMAATASYGETSKRELHSDDEAAVSYLYPGDPSPSISSVSPSSGLNSGAVNLVISGAYFDSNPSVVLSLSGQSDISASSVSVTGETEISATFDLQNVHVGTWTLQVTNADSESGSTSFTVEDDPNYNISPTARAGEDQSVSLNTEVILDGSASYDNDGDDLAFSWSIESQPQGSSLERAALDTTSSSLTFTPDKGGAYLFTLTVDDGSTTSTDSITVNVQGAAAAGGGGGGGGGCFSIQQYTPPSSGQAFLNVLILLSPALLLFSRKTLLVLNRP